jgi:Ran-binding protein 9/10
MPTHLLTLPGLEAFSVGYRSDNGMVSDGAGYASEYGPRFGTGDTVGVGVTYDYLGYFTKNGRHLGL